MHDNYITANFKRNFVFSKNNFRLLTFCYLAAFNWWLVLCPSTLSHDWQMGSIPLLTSISDPRNLVTFVAFGAAIVLAYKGIIDVEVRKIITLKCSNPTTKEWLLTKCGEVMRKIGAHY